MTATVQLWVPILTLTIGVIIGVGITFWITQVRTAEVERIRKELAETSKTEFSALSMNALSQASDQFLKLAQQTLSTQTEKGAEQLDGKKALIDESLKKITDGLGGVQTLVNTLEKDRENKFGELASQLKNAAEQTEKLQNTTAQLQAALANTQTRGQWGERMAEDVLRIAGFIEGVNYLKQKTVSDFRPDFTFFLPHDRKVNMDVKFPLNNYLAHLEAQTEHEKKQKLQSFLKDVRARVREVTSREYISREGGTVDYMLVFIPNEQVYAFIGEHDRTLWEEALRQKVILCSPMTLFAILAIIRQAVDNFYLEERATEILATLGGVKKEWEKVVGMFDAVQKGLTLAQKAFTDLTGVRTRQLDAQFSKVDRLIEDDQRLRLLEGAEDAMPAEGEYRYPQVDEG